MVISWSTQTTGNSRNRIRGSRIRFWVAENNGDGKELIGELVVPHKDARYYCRLHPGGKYGKRYYELLKLAEQRVIERMNAAL